MIVVVIVAGVALVTIAALSFRSIFRDVRGLHRSGKQLTDREVDVDGVSPGGVTAMGNNITH